MSAVVHLSNDAYDASYTKRRMMVVVVVVLHCEITSY